MKKLTYFSDGQKAKITAINGDKRYLTRITVRKYTLPHSLRICSIPQLK